MLSRQSNVLLRRVCALNKPCLKTSYTVSFNPLKTQSARFSSSLTSSRVIFQKDHSQKEKDAAPLTEGVKPIEESPKKKKGGIMNAVKSYGLPFISTWAVLYAATLFPFQQIFKHNPILKVHVQETIHNIPSVGEYLANWIAESPGATDWILAVVCSDLLEVVRIPFAIYVARRYIAYKKSKVPESEGVTRNDVK